MAQHIHLGNETEMERRLNSFSLPQRRSDNEQNEPNSASERCQDAIPFRESLHGTGWIEGPCKRRAYGALLCLIYLLSGEAA